MIKHYKLVGRKPVRCSFEESARQFGNDSRQIARTEIANVLVSTIFLVIDHNWMDGSPPQLFETMCFETDGEPGAEYGQYMNRYATYQQALNGHNRVVEHLRTLLKQAKGFTYAPYRPPFLPRRQKPRQQFIDRRGHYPVRRALSNRRETLRSN